MVAYALYATILIEGLILASIGPLLDALGNQSGSSVDEISILFIASSVGYITGSLLAGTVFSHLRGNAVLTGALSGLAVLSALVPGVASLALLATLFFGIGLAVGLIDVGCNTLLVWLYRGEVAPHMNVLHLSFGIGAVLSPLLIDRVDVFAGDAVKTYWLFAALMVPIAVWMLLTSSPRQPADATSMQRSGVVRRHALFLGIIGLFFFMHVGAQSSIGGWIFNFAEEQGRPETTARLLNSVFWGGLVLGRLAAIPISRRLRPLTVLTIDLIGAAASLGVIALFPNSAAVLWLGSAGFGASIASVFATSINFAERRIPITSHVTAVFLVGGSAGSMTMPWIIGQYFESSGPETMLWVAGGAVAAAAVLLSMMNRRAPGRLA